MLLQLVYWLQNSDKICLCFVLTFGLILITVSSYLVQCVIPPDMHCLLFYFLICHYSVFKFVKGQELKITFYLFSVYFGELFLPQNRKVTCPISMCSVGYVSSVWAAQKWAMYYGSSLRTFMCSGLMKILYHILQQVVVTSSLMT